MKLKQSLLNKKTRIRLEQLRDNKIKVISSKKRLGRDVEPANKVVTCFNYFIESESCRENINLCGPDGYYFELR